MGSSSAQSVVRRSPEHADGNNDSSTAMSMQTVVPYTDYQNLVKSRSINRQRLRVPLSSRFFVGSYP
ncbi:hypothetical protein [Corynebacterium parakroppenstedtii]|uniref:hypothetical protein n=1 Tax=Corynebacterium parakroppenstedtii TaxID=2828363 RepID=UPI001EF043B7|nr:hypothetical protein [Corynebacterium parakroppenstedtii]MCF6784822.1 hypothetical protein [Corynebacterium parakroppenstedtii]MCF6791155.1 hypothetical protein [Corynebacterium parakroppenstedtii]